MTEPTNAQLAVIEAELVADDSLRKPEESDCLICDQPTDHVSGVCDRCCEPDETVFPVAA